MGRNLNIFLMDYGCRSQASNLPYYYSRLGHRVYMLKPGEFSDEWGWGNIPVWPRMLHKPEPTSKVRNLEKYPEVKYTFGEDCFLVLEKDEILSSEVYSGNAHVTLLTEKEIKDIGGDIDLFHTTDHCKPVLEHRLRWVRDYLPNAKWISSTFNPGEIKEGSLPLGIVPKNPCVLLPSPCENLFDPNIPGINRFLMFRHPFELDLQGIDMSAPIERDPRYVVSFNHNFHVRDKPGYGLFCQIQEFCKGCGLDVVNFGGNIRGQGADLAHSGGGPSGSDFITLSPRKCIEQYRKARVVLHLKNHDWAGGVPANARFTSTPMITSRHFIDSSNYGEYFNEATSVLLSNEPLEVMQLVLRIALDDDLFHEKSAAMEKITKKMFDNDYWDRFNDFVNTAMDDENWGVLGLL